MTNKTLGYLYSLERFGIRLGLETMQRLMELLGHPERKFRSIHIAGTNGKGSTAAFTASILQAAGMRIGLYTSPHLVRFSERIRIGRQEITDGELTTLTGRIRALAEQHRLQPTFFEFTTALAFLFFARKKVDAAVIEAGMGGRLDATNVITPEVAVITNISLDHQEHLGSTLSRVAGEKAGIIKPDIPLVTAETSPRILSYFRKICGERNSPFIHVQEHLAAAPISGTLDQQRFSLSGTVQGTFATGLLGAHQIANACTALLAVHCFTRGTLPYEVLQQGLAAARWPARLEIVSRQPLIIVDGAHNIAGMRALVSFIRKLPNRRTLLIGIAKDKDIAGMVRLIAPLFKEVIVTQGSYKPAPTRLIAAEARKHAESVREIPRAAEALAAARKALGKDDLLLITGSLYVVGDASGILRQGYAAHSRPARRAKNRPSA